MGSYLFTWSHPAREVYVTGTFDDWGRTVKLDKIGDRYEKRVALPQTNQKIEYKFVVDGEWTTDPTAPQETDRDNNTNNVLAPDQIDKTDASRATLASVGAGATTAGLAGQVPKEQGAATAKAQPSMSDPIIKGASTGATTQELAGKVPKEGDTSGTASDPIVKGASTSSTVAGLAGQVPKESDKGPSDPTIQGGSTSNTVAGLAGQVPKESGQGSSNPAIQGASASSTAAGLAGQVPKESDKGSSDLPGAFPETPRNEAGPEVSAKPLPATAGLGNPIQLAPGEPVPPASSFTDHTVQSTVRTDGSAADPNLPAATASAAAEGGKKPQVIPESGLPMGPGATQAARDAGAGATIQSVGAGATTAQLAGQVPKEPRGVPEVVEKSQAKADVGPEASANATAVKEKGQVEQELTSKVPEQPAAADNSVGGKVAGYATGAAAGVTAAVSGAAAYFGSGKATDDAKAKLPEGAHPAVDKVAAAGNSVSGSVGGISGSASKDAPAVASTVPDEVQKSIAKSDQPPEAAANKAAVAEKADVENELLQAVKKETQAGEPAPTATAATSTTAPQAGGASTSAPLAESKPDGLKSTEKPLDASTAKAEGSSKDDAANGKAPATESADPVAAAGLAAPAAASTSTPSKARGESRDLSPMSRPGESSAAASPRSVDSRGTGGSKRRSILGKLKDKLAHARHKDNKDAGGSAS